MALNKALRCALLVALVALAVPGGAHAGADHKGKLLKGKGAAVAPVDVQSSVDCQDQCEDVCVPVPRKVCNDVPYPSEQCAKVPVTTSVQKCERVCQKTLTITQTAVLPTAISTGKGKGAAAAGVAVVKGKGRRLAEAAGKEGLLPKLGKGKGAVATVPADVNVQCQDVCTDVPVTSFTTQCKTVTLTKTECNLVTEQQCSKVCKKVCQKTTVLTQTVSTPIVAAVPVVASSGKGAPVVALKGKGKGL